MHFIRIKDFLLDQKFPDLAGLKQSGAPLTETRARSELSAQCLKLSGFPLKLTFLKRERALQFFTHKKFCQKHYFLLLLFL
jgi:hypothetical protein